PGWVPDHGRQTRASRSHAPSPISSIVQATLLSSSTRPDTSSRNRAISSHRGGKFCAERRSEPRPSSTRRFSLALFSCRVARGDPPAHGSRLLCWLLHRLV